MESQALASDLAVKRTKAYFRSMHNRNSVNRNKLYNVLKGKPIKKNNFKKLKKLILMVCPDAVSIVMAGINATDGMLCINFVETVYQTTLEYKDLEGGTVSDIPHSTVFCTSIIVWTGGFRLEYTINTWHAVKRLFERHTEMRALDDKAVGHYLCKWMPTLNGEGIPKDAHAKFVVKLGNVEARGGMAQSALTRSVVPIINTYI